MMGRVMAAGGRILRLVTTGRRGIVLLGVLLGIGWRYGLPHRPLTGPIPRATQTWSASSSTTVTEQLESGAIRVGPAANPGGEEPPNEGAPSAVIDTPAA